MTKPDNLSLLLFDLFTKAQEETVQTKSNGHNHLNLLEKENNYINEYQVKCNEYQISILYQINILKQKNYY
ncbi:MAG: hypothetical protein Q8831_02445 ['Bonamia sp.' little leaf phytoplasma]|nr:hypothetical protein ['Bonamia sp.' little leaf phytoplasma]